MPDFESINLSREVRAEIITPVHVGAASEKILRRGTDFFWENGKLFLFDFSNLLKAVRAKNVPLGTLTNHLASNKIRELETYLFKTLQVDLESVSYRIINFSDDPGNEIRPMIRNGAGLPYLPGSSVKGALRSVIFNYLYNEINPKVNDKGMEKFLLGDYDKSIMRYVRVGDAHLQNEDTDVWYVNLFNLKNDGKQWKSTWKKGFNLPIELLKPETTTAFRLNLAKPLADNLANKYRKSDKLPQNLSRILTDSPFDNLCNIINDYTRLHINKELDFLKKYDQAPDSGLLIENMENLLPLTNEPNTCLLRMAFGSGFHGITGDWRFQDHLNTIHNPDEKNWMYSPTARKKEPARYKSRKVTGANPTLMGFIKLTF